MTFEPIEYEPDDYELDDTPAAPILTAAAKARTKLANSRKHVVFGRVLVEHLLAECDAFEARVAELEQQLTGAQARLDYLEGRR